MASRKDDRPDFDLSERGVPSDQLAAVALGMRPPVDVPQDVVVGDRLGRGQVLVLDEHADPVPGVHVSRQGLRLPAVSVLEVTLDPVSPALRFGAEAVGLGLLRSLVSQPERGLVAGRIVVTEDRGTAQASACPAVEVGDVVERAGGSLVNGGVEGHERCSNVQQLPQLFSRAPLVKPFPSQQIFSAGLCPRFDSGSCHHF
jgi:hypothetical protein